MARQSDHLAEEMSRFEQEILGGSGAPAGGHSHQAPPPPPQPLMSHIPPHARPPGPPPGMPPGPPRGMPPGPPPGMPPGPPRSMPPGPPGPPGGLPPRMPPPPGQHPDHGPPPSFNSAPPHPLLGPSPSRPPPGGPPLGPPPGRPGPPHGGMHPGPPHGGMHPGPSHSGIPPGPLHSGMPPGPLPGGVPPGQSFRPPPPNSNQVPTGVPPPKHPQVVGAVLQQVPMALLPQPPPAPPVTAKPTPPSMMAPVPVMQTPQVAMAAVAVQPSLSDATGATGGGVTPKIFPAPTRPLKTKRDPKKLRLAGGQVWEDHSLGDWDQNDFRIFCGDLGNDVNDDTLARSFSKYSSFLKAKVIRDKYTKKTKGYGFVSFKDPHDFMQAMREMNGKYIGNRPVKLRKSTWRERCFEVVKKRDKEKKKLGFK